MATAVARIESLDHEGRGIAAFEQGDGLSRRDRVGKPLVDPDDGAVGAGRQKGLALRRSLDRSLGDDLAAQ